MFKLIVFLAFLLSLNSISVESTYLGERFAYCWNDSRFDVLYDVTNETKILFSHFRDPNEIDWDCVWYFVKVKNGKKFWLVFDFSWMPFGPVTTIDMNSSKHTLDLHNDLDPKDLSVELSELKGFNLALKDHFMSWSSYIVSISFVNSILDFYDESGSLIDSEKCSTDYFENKSVRIFSGLEKMNIRISMYSVDLTRPICPYLFQNANIRQLSLLMYHRSLNRHIRLSFYDIRNPKNLSINLNITIQELYVTGPDCNSLSPDFYEGIKYFRSAYQFQSICDMATIQSDFFRNFEKLELIMIRMNRMRNFYHYSTNEWLSSIFHQVPSFENRQDLVNYHINSSSDATTIPCLIFYLISFSNTAYFYPEEDFCLFKHFPVLKPIHTGLGLENNSDMGLHIASVAVDRISCAGKYLIQNNFFYLPSFLGKIAENSLEFLSEEEIEECEFQTKLSLCSNISSFQRLPGPVDLYEDQLARYVLEWIEVIGPIITLLIISAVAFILNLLIILTIRSKKNQKEKLFGSKLFKFIQMNSTFNCIECVIYQTKLMGVCMDMNSFFCSSIHSSRVLFYFQTMSVYLGEVMKTCSMVSGLLFSIQRYVDTGNSDSRFLKWFSKANVNLLFFCTMAFALISSVPMFFDIHSYLISETRYIRWVADKFQLVLDLTYYNSGQVKLSFYIIHFILNDFVTLILNLIVDIRLIQIIKSDLDEKLKNKFHNKTDLSELDKKKLKDEEKKKTSVERKANAMIVVNVFIYLICRLPEIGSLFFYFFTPELTRSCTLDICHLVSDFIDYLYILSYMFNIFIYYKFNTNFNKGLRNFFGISARKSIK